MGPDVPLAEGAGLFYQPRLAPDRPPARFTRVVETDRWRSGRSRTLGKRVYVKAYRGFESLSVRHDAAESREKSELYLVGHRCALMRALTAMPEFQAVGVLASVRACFSSCTVRGILRL